MVPRRKIILNSPRLREQKRKKILLRLSLVFFLLIVLAIVFYIIVRLPVFNVSKVEVSGTEVLDPLAIEAKAKESLGGNIYFLIPKSNLFFYQKDELKDVLLKEMPRIDTLSLDLSKNTLHISVTEKNPFALWCDANDKCYFVDSVGEIFSEAPDFNGVIYKKFYGAVEGDPIGKTVLSKEVLEKVKEIYDVFDSLKVVISKIQIISPKEIRLSSIYDVDFLFNLDQSVEENKENIETILKSDRFKDSLPRLKGMEYIDFRFGGKVFFKKS